MVAPLLELNETPPPDFTSNEGVIEAYIRASTALGQCNNDKLFLREQLLSDGKQ